MEAFFKMLMYYFECPSEKIRKFLSSMQIVNIIGYSSSLSLFPPE